MVDFIMRNKITYEWTLEILDDYDDIVDVHFFETLCNLLIFKQDIDDVNCDVGIVKHLGNDADGIVDREYAYINRGKLPEKFDGGYSVPKRFKKEFEKNWQ